MIDLFENLPEAEQKKLEETDQPHWTEPMLATLTHERFSDKAWIFERKLDGERCLAFRQGKTLRLMSRNRKELNDTYPELVDALLNQKTDDFIVDGEIVAFEDDRTSFARLQNRMHLKDPEEARRSKVAVFYYLFDILYLKGFDVSRIELRRRKSLLKQAIDFDDPLRFLPHRNEEGETYYREACEKGWEGVIAKQADSEYVHSRSKKWLKFKCVNQQEFVIGGYTEPQGTRIGFGALLIGYYEDDKLRYAGKVGTGYDDDTLEKLSRKIKSIERETPPFGDDEKPHEQGGHWVQPELVAQVGFTEWTEEGKLRHPRFLGLRRDKDPKDVTREKAE